MSAWTEHDSAIYRDIASDEMFRTFNMGIGFVVGCAARDAQRVINTVARAGEPDAVRIGFVVSGDRTVHYTGAP